MNSDRVLLSLSPEKLPRARSHQWGIELKFDWEHRELLDGSRSLSKHIRDIGIDPGRIASVHLPPGTERRGDDIGMALTAANRGAIVDFVHTQLDCVPAAYLTAHPPKTFDQLRQLELIGEVASITGREISVENTPDVSDWHTPEAMALLAVTADHRDRFDDVYCTVDSAHLPGRDSEFGREPLHVDERALTRLQERPERGVPIERVRTHLSTRLDEGLSTVGLTRETALQAPDSRYCPLLKTLLLVGQRVRSVHLNDPRDDTVPDVTDHEERPVLAAALQYLDRVGGYLVVEGGRLWETPEELVRRLEALIDWVET